MKKIYIAPKSQAIVFCAENVLALSTVNSYESDSSGATTGGSDALSNKADLTHQGIWANMND